MRTKGLIGIALIGCALLTACSPATHSSASDNSVGTSTNITTNMTSNASTPSDTTTNQPGTDNTSGAPSAGGNVNAAQLVNESMTLAKHGKVIDIPVAEQSNISDVEQVWGRTPAQTSAGAGIYATYTSRHAAFGFNKGGQIFDLRAYSSQLQTVTLNDIQNQLGKPGAVRESSDSFIYLYPAGPDYQLLWVFPKTSTGKPAAHLDHVSVFWPQGTINSMAQVLPKPSVVLDNPPGTVGTLFTFSVINSPKDYHLAELEWIPTQGAPVVNTFSQAFENGQTGNNIPGFSISGDGQTMSFLYASAMNGQSGRVRLIFQATSGAAMIAESDSITLK